MTFLVSHAQNFEDVVLWRAVGDAGPGVYVDVGAQSPDVDSVSRLFFEQGWRGTHVEPVPAYAQALRDRRPGDSVVQAAVAASRGLSEFHVFHDTGLSTLDGAVARSHVEAGRNEGILQVATVTLDDVLATAGSEIHWLKIDVEGAEAAVIEGWRGDVRPWIVVVEATRPMSQAAAHDAWEPALLSRGYTFALFDGLNRFYVADAHLDRLPRLDHGACVFDGFALGADSTAPFGAAHRAAVRDLEEALSRERTAHQQLETLLSAARAEAAATNSELAAVVDARNALEIDVTAARQALRESERAREALQFEIADVRSAVTEAEAAVDALRTEVTAARQALTEAESRYLRELAANAERHAEHLAARETAQQATLERVTMRHAEERAQLLHERSALHAHNEDLVRDVQWLRAELSVQRDRTLDAVDDARRWQAMAQGRSLELSSVYASTSWRVTAPLRASRLATKKIAGSTTKVVQRARAFVRAAVISTVRFLGQSKSVRRFGVVTLAPFPALERRVRAALLDARPFEVVLPVTTVGPDPSLAQRAPCRSTDEALSPYANALLTAVQNGTRNA